jgi:hypothetical protein
MKLIGLGLALGEGERLYGVVPRPGLTVVTLPEASPNPEVVAEAWRAALSSPAPALGVVAVTVRAEAKGQTFTILDEHPRRTMLEGAAGALPRALELDPEALEPRTLDGLREEALSRIAAAAELSAIAHFAAALTQTEAHRGGAATPTEQAYVAARRKAEVLAQEVRGLDDQMTASVVPDWLWIATGAGGLGVFMTLIALMYPELRVYSVLSLVVFSVIGFGLYGWRAYGELGTRARLLEVRAERRAAREVARGEAKEWAERLRQEGGDPDAALIRLEGLNLPPQLPAIVALPEPTLAALQALDLLGRQVVVVTSHVPAGTPVDWHRPLLEEKVGPE